MTEDEKLPARARVIVSLDLETWPFGRAQSAPRPVCLSGASSEPGWRPFVLLIDQAQGYVKGVLQSSHTLIGVNITYDMAVLGEYWPYLLPLIFAKYKRGEIQDVGINEKILRIAAQGRTEPMYGMEGLCEIYGLECPDKDGPWRLDFPRLAGIDPADWPAGAREYVLGDASTPLLIHAKQQALDAKWTERFGSPCLHLAGVEAYKAFVLHLMSCWGVHTQPEWTEAWYETLCEFMAEAKPRLQAAKLVRENGSKDTKAAKAYMISVCAGLGIEPRLTDTGQVSLNKEATEATHDDLLITYSMYSQADTLMSRAQDLREGYVLPLQSRFDSLLETSRTSSSKPKSPFVGAQMQNFPRMAGARECLTPRPGHVFLTGDLPTAELRSLSQFNLDVFGVSVMAEQINAGRDLHTWFAAQMMGCTYEELTLLVKAKDLAAKAQRDGAKTSNFGFPGGQGIESFIAYSWRTYKIRLTVERAKQLKAMWLAAFPEMRLFFQHISKQYPGDRHYALVKHLRSGRWRGRVPYCANCNTQFQEPTAVGASSGLCETSYECYTQKSSPLFNSRVWGYTHDEICLETPEECAPEAANRLGEVMKMCFNEWHPDVPIQHVEVDIRSYYGKS